MRRAITLEAAHNVYKGQRRDASQTPYFPAYFSAQSSTCVDPEPLARLDTHRIPEGHPWPQGAPSQSLAQGPLRLDCREDAAPPARLLKLIEPNPMQLIPSSNRCATSAIPGRRGHPVRAEPLRPATAMKGLRRIDRQHEGDGSLALLATLAAQGCASMPRTPVRRRGFSAGDARALRAAVPLTAGGTRVAGRAAISDPERS
jgi:hypothetical protein